MKKLLTFALTLSLVCCLASCNNSDENSKTAELEKRVAELESQINEQSTTTTTTTSTTTTTASSQTTTTTTTTEKTTTTTTTTAATTTPETTTTTTQTFDTSYYAWDETERYNTSVELDLYSAPDKNAKILYTIEPYVILDVCGEVNDAWLAVIYNDQVVFANRWVLSKVYDISLETISIPPIYENSYNFQPDP